MPSRITLGELETSVLEVLWRSREPMSVRDVLAELGRKRALAYTTVLTVLDRLHDKRLVVRHREGKAFLYAARTTREEFLGERAASVLSEGRTAPSRELLMAFLDSAERASPELLEELESLVAERRRRRQR
jgi:predicted transcriptional regulator